MRTISFSSTGNTGYVYAFEMDGEFEATFKTDSDGHVEFFEPSKGFDAITPEKENDLCAYVKAQIVTAGKVREEWKAFMRRLSAEMLGD